MGLSYMFQQKTVRENRENEWDMVKNRMNKDLFHASIMLKQIHAIMSS